MSASSFRSEPARSEIEAGPLGLHKAGCWTLFLIEQATMKARDAPVPTAPPGATALHFPELLVNLPHGPEI
ncbi:MAG: hypothetical protein CMP28_06155 [Roseibacillus sp.]|nr:hypothetical protein [Roseibacillus sp.]MBL48517.1 hypothetical protein [Roseibacillus sp.]